MRIEKVNVKEFGPIKGAEIKLGDLTAITGETGAGKSLLLRSIAFLLGVESGEGEVNGEIVWRGERLRVRRKNSILYVNGDRVRLRELPWGEEVVFLSPKRKYTFFISTNHTEFVDALVPPETLSEVERTFKKWKKIGEELSKHTETLNRLLEEDVEGLEVLSSLSEKDLDVEKSWEELKELMASGSKMREAVSLLVDGEGSVVELLARTVQLLRSTEFRTKAEKLAEEAGWLAEEINEKLASASEKLSELAHIQERAELLQRLKFRFRKKTVEELLALKNHLEQVKEELENSKTRVEELHKKEKLYLTRLQESSEKLRKEREKRAQELCRKLNETAPSLNLKMRFHYSIVETDFSPKGTEKVILTASSKSSDLKPLNSLASSGELQRVLLLLFSLTNSDGKLLLLDEAETGVGGTVAWRLGEFLKRTSERNQVILVTHLHQIARFADTHVLVEEKGNGASVKPLKDLEEREREYTRLKGELRDAG